MISVMRGRSRPAISPDTAMAARPVRLIDAELQRNTQDTWRLTVPVRPPRWAARFLRLPNVSTRTFELDALGARVWQSCDGRTSVRDIVAALATEYGLTPREAEVATREFLRTLALKGLIGVAREDS